MSSETEDHPDRFKDVMGALIAIVALLTAVAAWRGSTAARTAGFQDYYALTASLNAEETRTLNNASAFQHVAAFTQFAINDELLTQLLNTPPQDLDEEQLAVLDAQIAEADRLATTNRNFFPARYALKDGAYDIKREMAEAFAEAQRRTDLDPEAHLAQAAAQDNRAFAFAQIIILMSVALVFYTLASVLHSARRSWRWSSAALGTVCLVVGVAAMVMTELS